MEKTGIVEELKNRYGDVNESLKDLDEAKGFGDKLGNGFRFAGKTLRFVTGIVTAPAVLALNVVSKAMPVVWETAVQALHIPAALISKIVKHDSPYNGQVINKIGNKIGTITEAIVSETSNVVHKAF